MVVVEAIKDALVTCVVDETVCNDRMLMLELRSAAAAVIRDEDASAKDELEAVLARATA